MEIHQKRIYYYVSLNNFTHYLALLTLCFLILPIQLKAQNGTFTMNKNNASILSIIKQVEQTSKYKFFYNDNTVNVNNRIDVNVKNASISTLLNNVFKSTDISYSIEGTKVLLITKEEHKTAPLNKGRKAISGYVVDEKNEPIIGASVLVKGTANGTITDIDGKFYLSEVPSNSSLVISYVGYVTQNVSINGKSNLRISLIEDAKTLDEIVVVGYGTQKKTDLTGSVMQVNSKDITAVTANNPIQSLQGRVTGVSVVTDSKIGASPTIRIRGNGSISAGNDPLYVVDGFPLMNGSLNELNANDIASIEVLKDASSTAIYGSRGSNGVIMITTKSGAKDSKSLSINANYGFQTPGRLIKTMTHDQFIDYINAAYLNSKGTTVYNNENPAPSTNTDWQRETLYSCRPVQDYNVSLNGTSGDTQYMMSGGLYLQDGLLLCTDYKKYTFRTNLQHKLNNFIKLGTHIQYAYSDANVSSIENGIGSLDGIWKHGWPTLSVYRDDGTYSIPSDNPAISPYFGDSLYWNPVANYRAISTKSSISRLFGDVYVEIQLYRGLTLKSNFGFDISNERDYRYKTSKSTDSSGTGTGGDGYLKQMSKINENILTYTNAWGEHRLTATGVYSWQDYTCEGLSISGGGFANDETGAFDMGQASRETVSYSSNKYDNKLISWTGRLSYAYKDRYLLTATARYDGSSRFGENSKWGFFPSVGLAWRASEEPFLAGNKVITNLKVRGSFGVTGNQEIGDYKSLAQLRADNYIYSNAEMQGYYETIGNPDLKWERANQFDFGVDLSLWDRLHITADYYSRKTSDLLYEVPIPSTSGYSSILSNVGSVLNHGLEVSINANIINTKDFKVDATVNLSRNRNKIKKLYNGVQSITLGSGLDLSSYLKVGEPLNSYYGLISNGIIKTDEQLAEYKKLEGTAKLGDEMYKDLDGDGQITVKDQKNIGTTDPKFIYGIGLDIQYKKLSLNVLGNGVDDFIGGSSYLVVAENQITASVIGVPSQYAYEHMWSVNNPKGNYPAAGASNIHDSDRINSGWYYFVLKSVTLNYDFGKNPFKAIKGIKGLSASLNFQNFVTFSNHRGYNPETGDIRYPWIKTVNVGISARF